MSDKLKNSALGISMAKNLLIKILCYVISIGYTPLLLRYLGVEKYGIWATVLSIISWVSFCDVGIGSGLRNILTKELSEQKYDEIKRSVSTAYIIISVIAVFVTCVLAIVSFSVNWKKALNVNYDLKLIFFISFLGIVLSIVLGLGKSILFALQLSENVALMELVSSVIQLLGLILLLKFTSSSLLLVALLFSLSSSVIYLGNDLILANKYVYLKPSFRSYDKGKKTIILNRGLLFLVLQLGGIAMTSTDNVLVSHFYGPVAVTPYSSMTRLFYAVSSLFIALIAPVWARTTVAYTAKDYGWIKQIVQKLSFLMLLYSLVLAGVGFFYKRIAFLWLGEELKYEKYLICITFFSAVFEMSTATLSSILNGMDILKIQAVIAIVQVVTNIPLSILLAKLLGLGPIGIKISTMVLFLLSTVVYYCVIISAIVKKTSSSKPHLQ